MSETGSSLRSNPPRDNGDDEEFWPTERRRSRDRRSKRSRVPTVIIVVLVVLIAGAVGWFVLSKQQAEGSGATDHPLPSEYVSTPNPQVTKLNQRSGDQRVLTLGEVFTDDAKTITSGPFTFTRGKTQLTGDCRSVTWGQRLQNDLRQYGCTQAARGVYTSQDKKYVGQFIAFNMDRLDGAEQVVRDLNPQSGAGFVLPLDSPVEFGGGFSAAYAQPIGHYVVMSWVQRLGGDKPQSMNELASASIVVERANGFVWQRLVLAGG